MRRNLFLLSFQSAFSQFGSTFSDSVDGMITNVMYSVFSVKLGPEQDNHPVSPVSGFNGAVNRVSPRTVVGQLQADQPFDRILQDCVNAESTSITMFKFLLMLVNIFCCQ